MSQDLGLSSFLGSELPIIIVILLIIPGVSPL